MSVSIPYRLNEIENFAPPTSICKEVSIPYRLNEMVINHKEVRYVYKFQFLIGSMKSGRGGCPGRYPAFQFLIGSMKWHLP